MTTMTLQAARNGLVPAQQAPAAPAVVPGFTSGEGFSLLQRMAQMLNQSSLVPEQFRGPANLGNTAIALELASRIGASPLMTMQHLYVVHGRPAWSASFMVACFNQSGRFSALRYTFVGEEGKPTWGCYASATELSTKEVLTGTTITLGMAEREGWTRKQGSKWASMPGQMLMYRAASWFIRAYAPELTMGLRTADEEREAPAASDVLLDRPQNREIAGNGANSPSDANSDAAPCPTTPKGAKAARTRVRAVSGETPRKASPQTLPETDPAPAPARSQEDELDAIEQAFVARCDKDDVTASEMLATYEAGVPGPVDPYESMADMLKNPDVYGAVLNALAARQ